VVSNRRVRPCRRAALAGGDQMQFDQLKRRVHDRFVKSFQYLLTDLHQFDILQSEVSRWRGGPMSELGRVSRVLPVHTAVRNCTRDEGKPFEVGNQVLISSHRKLLSSKAMVVNVAETPGQDSGRQG
jgi:hypothetical protein